MRLGRAVIEGVEGTRLETALHDMGARPAYVPLWCRWEGPEGPLVGGREFPWPAYEVVESHGIRPIIYWEPGRVSLRSIVDGEHDDYLRGWALMSSAVPPSDKVLVRFAHEFNGPWMPWSMSRDGNSPALYAEAWRHVVGVTRHVNPRLRFIWCPNVTPWKPAAMAQAWPGKAWVDYVGLDGYAWSKDPLTAARIFGTPLRRLRDLSDLPVIIGEFGITSAATAAARVAWLSRTVRWFELQDVHAAIYFDIDMHSLNPGHPNWRLRTTVGMEKRWDDLVRAR